MEKESKNKGKKREESAQRQEIDNYIARALAGIPSDYFSSVAKQFEKTIPSTEAADMLVAYQTPLSDLLEIKPAKIYTEKEYRKLLAKIETLQKNVKKAQKKWKREHPRELLRQHLLRYFSAPAVDRILNGQIQLGTGHRCEMTILSCDIRNFTKFTNDVDPEYLTEVLNKYLVTCTEIFHSCDGIVDKYLGDGILAYFGCLDKGKNHALSACEAAIEIVVRQHLIFKEWYDKLLETPKSGYLGIGIGIATGPAYWDYIGTPSRRELTIVGKHVNLASRLQSIAKAGEILVTNITRARLKGKLGCEKLGKPVSIHGFEERVDIFRLKRDLK